MVARVARFEVTSVSGCPPFICYASDIVSLFTDLGFSYRDAIMKALTVNGRLVNPPDGSYIYEPGHVWFYESEQKNISYLGKSLDEQGALVFFEDTPDGRRFFKYRNFDWQDVLPGKYEIGKYIHSNGVRFAPNKRTLNALTLSLQTCGFIGMAQTLPQIVVQELNTITGLDWRTSHVPEYDKDSNLIAVPYILFLAPCDNDTVLRSIQLQVTHNWAHNNNSVEIYIYPRLCRKHDDYLTYTLYEE